MNTRSLISIALFLLSLSPILSYGKDRDLNLQSPNPQQVVDWVENNLQRALIHFAKHHTGIELIVADGTTESPESFAGHIFIRFTGDDNNNLNDTIIDFNQLTLSEEKKYDKAMGDYPMVPYVHSYVESIVQYMKSQRRGLRRFIIPSTIEQIAELKKSIIQIIKIPSLVGNYHFTKNNCLTGTLKILRSVGYPVYQVGYVDVPFLAKQTLRTNFMDYYPDRPDFHLRGATDVISKLERKLLGGVFMGISPARITGGVRSVEAHPDFWSTVAALTPNELERLHLFWPVKWVYLYPQIAAIYKNKIAEKTSLRDLIGNADFSESLYRICELSDDECRENRKAIIQSMWTKDEIKRHYSSYKTQRTREIAREQQMIGQDASRLQLLNSFIPLDLEKLSFELLSSGG